MSEKRLNPETDFLIVERNGERIFVHTEQMEETFYSEREGAIDVLAKRNFLDAPRGKNPEYNMQPGAGVMFVADDAKPSADGLRRLLKEKKLTGSQAAQIVGVNGRTIRKWTGGERAIPNAAWRLLLMAETKEELLRRYDFQYIFDRNLWVNREKRKIFSEIAVEDHDMEWIRQRIEIPNKSEDVQIFFNGPVDDQIKTELKRQFNL